MTTRCPHCGRLNELATHLVQNVVPSPGDVSICIDCLQVAVFNDDLSLRAPTDEERALLMENEELQLYLAAGRAARKERGLH